MMPRQSLSCSWTTAAACTFLTTSPFTSLCFIVLLWIGGARAFSGSAAGSATTEFCQHTIVQHKDQLLQRRWRHDRDLDSSEPVPPPHLFCIPAPGGNICLVVDENNSYHALRDYFPPLGAPVSQTGVVDSQVGAIGDSLFGTRFHLKDGTVRGPWCPGGGTAGPLLLRLARHRRQLRLASLLMTVSQRIITWTRVPSRIRRKSGARARARPQDSSSFQENATGLEVLAVTEQPDGSLTVALPRSPSLSCPTAAGEEADEKHSQPPAGMTVVLDDASTTEKISEPSPHDMAMFAAACGLEGYDH